VVARAAGAISLLLLAAYALVAWAAARAAGITFEAWAPWPLGGDSGTGLADRMVPLVLALALGWGVPGVALALLTRPRREGSAWLGRALGLGVGYVVLVVLGHAAVLGRAPSRASLLVLLAVPPLVLVLRPGVEASPHPGILVAAPAAIAVLTVILWPKLAHEALNGDGTEAYELARSLDAHRAPHWDLERSEGPGSFGVPVVNPFLTNSSLTSAAMIVLGRGELAARVAYVPALVVAALLALPRTPRATASAWIYVAALTALYALWSAYWVGYEPAVTDLAEPAATDTLATALLLAGLSEVLAGSTGFGIAFLLLASGILYSAPVLATAALLALALLGGNRTRPLVLWTITLVAAVATAVALGYHFGHLGDWYRQLRSEYWFDFVAHDRRTPSLPVLGLLALMTGGLPLVAALRFRRLSLASRVLLVTAACYLAVVLASSYKNLHYLAPLPFLLAAPALEAAGPKLRAAATAILIAAFTLSWPSTTRVHEEARDLARDACLDGLGYEEAALRGGVVYEAFAPPGGGGRFAIGKHTFARYALDLGGPGCHFRLSAVPREGWIPVAGSDVTLSIRDVDRYARWRLDVPAVPTSPLFRRPPAATLPLDPEGWTGRLLLAKDPAAALAIGQGRLLVPVGARTELELETWAPATGVVEPRVNGIATTALPYAAGDGRTRLSVRDGPWRPGWNILDLGAGRPEGTGVHIVSMTLR
jgi:hypothetical protein